MRYGRQSREILFVNPVIVRNIRVIPVLLDGAMMPSEDALPEPLRPFARRNAIEVSNTRFNSDVEILVDAVGKALGEPSRRDSSISSPRRSLLYWVAGALGLGGVVPIVRLVNRWIGGKTPVSDSIVGFREAGWRFCGKCQSLFYDGHATKGVCPAGGPSWEHTSSIHTANPARDVPRRSMPS